MAWGRNPRLQAAELGGALPHPLHLFPPADHGTRRHRPHEPARCQGSPPRVLAGCWTTRFHRDIEPGIRRLVDFCINGAFNPLPRPSANTPLIVSALLNIPAMSCFGQLHATQLPIAMLIMGRLAHGMVIGFMNSGIGAVYHCAR